MTTSESNNYVQDKIKEKRSKVPLITLFIHGIGWIHIGNTLQLMVIKMISSTTLVSKYISSKTSDNMHLLNILHVEF